MEWCIAALLLAGAAIGLSRYVSASRRRIHRATYPDPQSLIVLPDEAARVTRQSADQVAIRWRKPAAEARVYAGSSPDDMDYAQALAQVADTDHVKLESVPAMPRPYFGLVLDDQPPLILSERSLPLAGVANARDIGGYPTQDGRQVRWGLVYRSGSLAGATGDDLDYLQHLGVRLVCDLRGADELAEDADRLPQNPAPEYRHLPVSAGEQTRERMGALMFNPRLLETLIDEGYTRYMVDLNGPVYGEMLRALADPANLPALIHCTAGKDRTGVTIALLLAVLGVSDDLIVADYSLSNRCFSVFRSYIAGKFRQPQKFLFDLNVDDFQPLLTAHPRTMRRTLDYFRQQYGSVESYLEQKAGVDTDVTAALKANLLA